MKPKVLVTRQVFDEVLAFLGEELEVESNQEDRPLPPEELRARLADKEGVMCALTDRIDAALVAACPRLKAVCWTRPPPTWSGRSCSPPPAG